MKLQNKYAVSVFAGMSLLAVVTGCSSTATAEDSTASTAPSDDSSSTADSGSTTSGTYTDGSYTESGTYTSPASDHEEVKVEVTLKDGVVTAVTVTPDATNPTGKQYQTQFAGGIAAVVVGKKIDDLSVSKVAGSSLTSKGFNAAIAKIKTDAAA